MLLSKLDRRTAQAFIGLNASPDWTVVEEWLEGEIVQLQHRLALETDEVFVRWYQGAIQVLENLRTKKAQAPKMFK